VTGGAAGMSLEDLHEHSRLIPLPLD
jgi:hypothetical protein